MSTTTTRIDRQRERVAAAMTAMRLFMLALLLALLGCLLSACTTAIDETQARACRAVVPALHETGAAITIGAITRSPLPRSLRIDYRVRAAQGPERGHHILCTFAQAGLGLRASEITALRTERGAVSGSSLYFLKRFWLEQAEAEFALPQSPPRPPLFGSASPGMTSAVQHITSGLPLIMITGLLASAYALIYGLVGRVLLVFGEFALLGSAATAFGVAAGEWQGITSPALLLLAGAGVCIWSAVWMSTVSVRAVFLPVLHRPGQHVIIISVGLALFLSEAIRLMQGSGRRWVSPVWNEPIILVRGPDYSATVTPSAIGVFITAFLFAAVLLAGMRRSAFGRSWRAVADDAWAAALMGVNRRAVITWSFVIAACLAAVTGLLLTIHLGGMGFSGGAVFGLKALVGAILGGIGSIGGALLGGLALGMLEMLWSATMPMEWRDAFVFSVLALVLVIRPGGFFGDREHTPRPV